MRKYKYKRKILVTLGTHLKWAKKTLTENIEKIAENFEDTLFVVTMGEKNREFGILAGKIKENMGMLGAKRHIYEQYRKKFPRHSSFQTEMKNYFGIRG